MIAIYALALVISMLGIQVSDAFPAMAADATKPTKDCDSESTTTPLKSEPNYTVPDGMAVRLLPQLTQGGSAHLELPPGAISSAISHRTVDGYSVRHSHL